MHSLPTGSKFNICFFGYKYEFIFPDSISVDNTDQNFKIAIDEIDKIYNNEHFTNT